MDTDTQPAMEKLLTLLDRIEAAGIWYRLDHVRDTIMVTTLVPGERWEIEIFADGLVEVERFRSDGHIGGEELIEELFRLMSDDADDVPL